MVETFPHIESISWDYIASIIAFVALIIAYITLRSQRETQRNTEPKIRRVSQKILLNQLILKIFDSYIILTAIQIVLKKKEFSLYPSEEIIMNLKIDENTLHTELFFQEPQKYEAIHKLLTKVEQFNIKMDIINNHLKDHNIPPDYYSKEMNQVTAQSVTLANVWSEVMTELYGDNDDAKWSRIIDLPDKFYGSKYEVLMESPKEDERNYFTKNNFWVKEVGTVEEKGKMLYFMNSYCRIMVRAIEQRLIPKSLSV